MVRRYGLEETRRFYRSQVEGIELVAELAERRAAVRAAFAWYAMRDRLGW